MKKFKALLALALALLMLALCACNQKSDNSGSSEPQTSDQNSENSASLQLLYCSNDTLNPYNTINKVNAELGQLIFDPLVTLSNEFEPINILAESVTVDSKACTVKLRSAKFSDGSTVTAEDVLNSYELAKKSPLYSHLFYNVIKASVSDPSTVVFELKNNDPFFSNMLTFPILKKGTENLKNEDNVEIVPTGSGRFVFSRAEESLIPNSYYYGNTSVNRISLIDAPDTESVEHYVEIGATDLYYTDPVNGNIIRMSGQKASLNMPNLVYIGINHNYRQLTDPLLRQTISSAVDRAKIAEDAYYQNAKSASGFFHPDWAAISGYQTLQLTAQTKICIENLEKIGYNNLDKDGFRFDSNGTALAFTLLVNRDNTARVAAAELIKSQLALVGIKITVTAVSNEQYFEALKSGAFQLYIGEVKLTPNMDIGELVLNGGSAAWGISASNKTNSSEESNTEDSETVQDSYADVLKGYYEGENGISEVATSLINHMPIIPIVYRNSLLFYSYNIDSIGTASAFNIFLSINDFYTK